MGKKFRKKYLLYILPIFLVGKVLFFLAKKRKIKRIEKNFHDFLEKEKAEADNLLRKKENLARYCLKSSAIFASYFIPHKCNDYKPKILAPRSLIFMAVSLFAIKILALSYILLIYPFSASTEEAMTSQILEMINNERQAKGLNSLKQNVFLVGAARAKADDMILNDYFAHYGADGKKPWDWINRENYPYIFVGENLAMNFSSAESAHTALMESEDHRHNIMNERYSDVGLAVVSGEFNGKQTNILVQMFGTRKEEDLTQTASIKKEEPVKDRELPAVAPEIEQKIPETQNVSQKQEVEEKQEINLENEDSQEQVPVQEIVDKQVPEEIKNNEKNILENKEIANQTTNQGEQKNNLEQNLKIEEQKTLTEQMEGKASPPAVVAGVSDLAGLRYDAGPAKEVLIRADKKINLATKILGGLGYVYIGVLAGLIILFLANIFIKITIQHSSVIVESLFLIFFVGGLWALNLTLLETIVEKVLII